MKQLEEAYLQKPNAHEVVLEYLNIRDVTTMVPKLKRFKFLDSLSFHANNLTFIPSLEILNQLRNLNLSRNPLKIDNKLMDSLFAIPNLEALSIDIHSEEQRETIIQNLPKLKYLNESQIQRKRQVKPPKEQEMKKIKQKLAEEEQNVKSLLYRMYKSLEEGSHPSDINQEVTFSIKCIIEEFEYFYENITSEVARSCVYLYYKHKMYQIIETHLASYLEDHGFQNIANSIEQMHKIKRQGFQDILKVILQFSYEQDFSNKTIQPGNKLRKETLYQNQITRLKKQIADLTKENQELHRVNQKYLQRVYQGKENVRSNKENGMKMSRSPRNKSNLPTPTNRHEQAPMNKSNSKKHFTRTPSKPFIKHDSDKTPEPNQTQQHNRTSTKNNLTPSHSKKEFQKYRELDQSPSYQFLPRHKQQKTQQLFQKTNSLGSFSTQRMRPNQSVKSIYKGENQEQMKRSTSKSTLSHEKKLTLDQVVQFIDEFIYEKGKFNLRSADKGELYQSPQEFLYTYFLRKYGLKEMALEWSLLIIKAIEKYSKENIIVEVFGKILKNNIQEEFYSKCKDFKEYLNPLIPLKDDFTVSQVRECFFEGFPHDDNENLDNLISKLDFQTLKGQKLYKRRTITLALESHFVKKHEKQILKFLNHFKLYDRDDDGILENDQIDKCIKAFINNFADSLHVYQSEQNMEILFQEIMAKRRKKGNIVSMTFSQFVAIIRQYI